MSEAQTVVSIDLFSDEERQIINQLAEGTGYTASRSEIQTAAVDLRNLTGEGDEDFSALIDGLCAKMNTISDTEWDGLKGYLPFPVNIAVTHDNIDGEIPDEEV